MKKNDFLKKVLSTFIFMGIIIIASSCQKEDDVIEPTVQSSQLKGSYTSGTNNGFFYSLYWEGGSASITFPNASQYPGNFQINYSNVQDVVGGKGWNPGGTWRVGYNVGSLSGSYNFVGVYGWTTNPLIEFYVADAGSVPGSTRIGTLSSDGKTYTVVKNQRVNAPSIQGTATFWQYISNGSGLRVGQNGTITMSNHVNYWRANCGNGFGTFNYMVFGLEAWGGKSGSINATVWRQ